MADETNPYAGPTKESAGSSEKASLRGWNIAKNIVSIITMLIGLATVAGFVLGVYGDDLSSTMPRGATTTSGQTLLIGVLMTSGGLQALRSRFAAIPLLALSCMLYFIGAVQLAWAEYGLAGMKYLNSVFYYALAFRVGSVWIVAAALLKARAANRAT